MANLSKPCQAWFFPENWYALSVFLIKSNCGQGVATAISAIQLALLILWVKQPLTRLSVASAALGFVGAVAVVILVGIEHNRILRPSSLVLLYLLATLFTDAIQIRTLFLRGYVAAIARLSCASLASRALLLVVESWTKESYLKPVEDGYSPEELASVFSRSVFWWLNPILLLGNRKILALEDLYPLNHILESSSLKARIVRSWDKRIGPSQH
jgi:ATP-binding cassette subfamily C (CFTR/MRP) protein 1